MKINMLKDDKDYLTREEALACLGVKAATLYAYVSRGLLRRTPDVDARRSLYSRTDVERLGARHRGALSRVGAAATSMRWGEPIINTSITYIDAKGPVYRNRAARDLAHSGVAFEAVVHLLLTGVWQAAQDGWAPIGTPADARDLLRHCRCVSGSADVGKMLASAVLALGMHGRGPEELAGVGSLLSARLILQTLAGLFGCLSPKGAFVERRPGETIAELLLRASGVPASADKLAVLNSVLIILADHELAAATFAARVAASTNSDLFNCVGAAICAHAGFAASVATDSVKERLFDALSTRNAASLLVLVQERGASMFGFNHPLYPAGDPRADYILELASTLGAGDANVRRFLAFVKRARGEAQAHPGIAVALTALVQALGLPSGSASALWILSRSAGWVAHTMEQRTQAFMLRPRAKYTMPLDTV